MDAAIACAGLRKAYKNGVKALDGVGFAVRPGEIFGLLGPNGAGKSTTVRILATLTRPDAGSARVAGVDALADPQAARRRLGYVAQASGVDKWATARENLGLQCRLLRVPPASIPARVDASLRWVSLADAADRIVKGFSGGMKRRLDLAMGLCGDPAVLFLDEPTTGLDPETRAALWSDLERLRKERNLAVLLTTHYLDEADRLCDRLAIIDRGKLVVEGTPAELKAALAGDSVALDLGEASPKALAAVRAMPGVLSAAADGNAVNARVEHGASALPSLITALERAGLPVRSATVGRPSLDDVYLAHTGRRFQGEGPAPAGED